MTHLLTIAQAEVNNTLVASAPLWYLRAHNDDVESSRLTTDGKGAGFDDFDDAAELACVVTTAAVTAAWNAHPSSASSPASQLTRPIFQLG